MRRLWGYLLVATGFVACPCYLPLTLPLVLWVLGGIGAGTFVGAHSGLIYGIATGYFVGAIALAVLLLNMKKRSQLPGCELPAQRTEQVGTAKEAASGLVN